MSCCVAALSFQAHANYGTWSIDFYKTSNKLRLSFPDKRLNSLNSNVVSRHSSIINRMTEHTFLGLPLIALFKSLINCKRRNKENFTLKSSSNKIMLCGVRGKHYLVLNKISTF